MITRDVAKSALEVYDVDELGLDRLDRAVLSTLTRSFGGGPVGCRRWRWRSGRKPPPSRRCASRSWCAPA
ncbi:holliday junction DNA helicase ruvB family protein [Mycobacterium xenopi 4042]|uniref:Holliday junction DNA helicase ruvB family protein n=1 Tax=Mycobacterium xenopi 4042 TaxID=1299334 RepID=X8DK58_MYCXE|nr:holliday junction DNA helicase ruvB family protein [Mycobacterium xenopi 3993]EUA68416.1 holliday junction DNA helicase ruvB family protein [Mycobacterium xenopi 4042]